MVTATNNKRQGAQIALAKAIRAREMMEAFRRVNVKPSNIKKL